MRNLAIFSTSDAELVRAILSCRNENNKVRIGAIITNIPNSPVIEVAKRQNIKYACFDHTEYPGRISHEKDIVRFLKKEKINLIIFAHYNRLVTKYFIDRFKNRIINVRLNPPSDFICDRNLSASGINESRCIIHYLDKGPEIGGIILQKELPLSEGDTPDSLRDRLHEAECDAVQMLMESLAV